MSLGKWVVEGVVAAIQAIADFGRGRPVPEPENPRARVEAARRAAAARKAQDAPLSGPGPKDPPG